MTVDSSAVKELHKLIREVVDQQPQIVGDDTVDVVAASIAEQTPVEKLTGFYSVALRSLVVAEYRARRNNAMNRLDAAINAAEIETSGRRRRDPRRTSPMVAAIRTWWGEMLDSRVFVKGREQRLGSCTVDDLDFIISDHEGRAAGHITKAGQYRVYRKMLIDNRAITLDDCPSPEAVA